MDNMTHPGNHIELDERVSLLAEEYLGRKRRGEPCRLTELLSAFPDLASEVADYVNLLELMDGDTPASPPSPWPYERLGDYRIEEVIGQGGMGIVCKAMQESLGRRVALKLMKQTHAEPGSQDRFRREARAVARLHHTNIIGVYGAGEENGQPYLAMQYVHGKGLDHLLTALRQSSSASTIQLAQRTPGQDEPPSTSVLSQETQAAPRERPGAATDESQSRWVHLRLHNAQEFYRRMALLIAGAADGLAHAHSRGVLHRDIKPSNLLLDDSNTLWISDFGLAHLSDEGNLTQTGYMVGTLRYIPPERLRGEEHELGDVYSLAATLYELLTLHSVFDGKNREELVSKISLQEPVAVRTLSPDVPRDLETIIHKALSKESSKRYPSAAAFAEDLRRFADNLPIQARPLGPVGRLARWSRRNPLVAGLTAALFATLLTGLILSSYLYFLAETRGEQSEDNYNQAEGRRVALEKALTQVKKSEADAQSSATRADQQRRLTERVKNFVVEILEEARPDRKGTKATVLDSVNAVAAKIPSKFADDRVLEAALHSTVGEIYRQIGQVDKALAEHRLALQLKKQEYGDQHLETLESQLNLAMTDLDHGKLKEGEALFRELLPVYEARLGPDDAQVLRMKANLGVILERLGKYDEALALQRDAFRRVREQFGEEDYQTLDSQNNLAVLLIRGKKPDEAVRLLNDLIAKLKQSVPEDNHRLLLARNHLVDVYIEKGQFAQALPIAQDLVTLQKTAAGEDDPTTLIYRNNLGLILSNLKRRGEAEGVLLDTIDRMEAQLPGSSPNLLAAYYNLGRVYFDGQQLAKAEPYFRKSYDGRKSILPPEHPVRINTTLHLARTVQNQGHHAEAIVLLTELVEALKDQPRSAFVPLIAHRILALSLMAERKYAEAEGHLLDNIKAIGRKENDPLQWTNTVATLVKMYKGLGKADQAAEWEKKK